MDFPTSRAVAVLGSSSTIIPAPRRSWQDEGSTRQAREGRGWPGLRRRDVLALLREHKPVLAEQYGVVDLALFGSASRDQARADSDVDILVSFDRPTDPERYFGGQFYIEDRLGRPVVLVTENALRAELRPYVEAEAIRV